MRRLLALRREASSALDELKTWSVVAATGGQRVHLHVSADGHGPLPAGLSADKRNGAPDAGLSYSDELNLRTFELE